MSDEGTKPQAEKIREGRVGMIRGDKGLTEEMEKLGLQRLEDGRYISKKSK